MPKVQAVCQGRDEANGPFGKRVVSEADADVVQVSCTVSTSDRQTRKDSRVILATCRVSPPCEKSVSHRTFLTCCADGAGSVVFISTRASVVLCADAEKHVLELEAVWWRQGAYRHQWSKLIQIPRAACVCLRRIDGACDDNERRSESQDSEKLHGCCRSLSERRKRSGNISELLLSSVYSCAPIPSRTRLSWTRPPEARPPEARPFGTRPPRQDARNA